jgi:HEAT repeat protein
MKFAAPLAMLMLAATALGAQKTPPTPPTPPLRPLAPLPAPRPLPAPIVAPMPFLDFDFDFDDLNRSVDLNMDFMRDFQLQSRGLADQARDQARMALQNVDVQQIREMAQDQARLALESPDLQRVQDMASMEAQRAMADIDLSGIRLWGSDERFAQSPRAPWAHDDPADSLYRLARESFNNGDWRRAADLFRDVVQKYPRSAYAADCAYYEAFSRYRIGTTDELHNALTLLSDQRTSATRSSMRADVAGLAARIRGALAARGDQQAAAQIAQDAQKNGGCDREDMSVKAEALNALGQMDPSSATPLLQRVLARKDTCSAQLKRSALFMLVRRGDSVSTNALIAVATNNDEDPALRSDAISYLGRMHNDAALSTVQNLIKSSDDDRIQRAAVRAVWQSDSPAARQGIRTLIDRTDVSESLRAEAINSLGSDRGTPDDAAFLRGAYTRMPSERLKQTVLRTLARIGGPENVQFLLGVARNSSESSDVRGTAVGYVGRDSTVSVATLVKLYDTSESRSMREQIIRAFARRSEPQAADKLMDIVKTSTDPYARRDAIDVLSRKKDDPRVTKFLLDLVGR